MSDDFGQQGQPPQYGQQQPPQYGQQPPPPYGQAPPGQFGAPAGYPQYAGPGGTPGGVPPGASARTNPLAITSLVCGIAQFILVFVAAPGLAALAALITGFIGLRQIGQRGERGRGMAIAGLILGGIGILIQIILIILAIVVVHKAQNLN
jgi:hypothetical protein